MAYFSYIIFRVFVGIFYFIPFRLIYWYSDFLSFFLGRILKYRRKVVLRNLKIAFPEKGEEEIKKYCKLFYKNLTDITLESFKGFTLTPEQIASRYRFLNPEVLDNLYDNKKSVLLLGSHYTNWEWAPVSAPSQTKLPMVGIYKGLKNKYIDNYMRQKRMKSGVEFRDARETFQVFEENKNKTMGYGLVADQSPSNIEAAIWVNFLNRETACLHGPEKYGRTRNYAAVYFDTQREKRGRYTVYFTILSQNPEETQPGELTQKYMAKLEEIIRKKPENWLWSHKRWKHNREDFQS